MQRRCYSNSLALLLAFYFACILVNGFVSKSYVANREKRTTFRSEFMTWFAASKNDDGDENKKLLEKARLLREEASQLEDKLRETAPARIVEDAASTSVAPLKITNLSESLWTLSYRFSSQPKDDDDDDSMKAVVLPNYSGKVTIRFLGDGYSELVDQSEDSKIMVKKVWGWDEEYSREDEQQYLLFSMDVTFPKTDPILPGQSERYYFQARIDRSESDQRITLAEGTVTCKKDIAEKTKGRWGLFQVAGILTQFRYVGDFVAKPSQ